MIKKLFFCLCGSIAIAPASHGQITKVKSLNEYQQVYALSDEFNGTTVNSSKWETFDRSVSRYFTDELGHPQTYVNDACTVVSGGSVKFTAKNETITATNNGWGPTAPKKFFYQAGEVVSRAFFNHGYYEIRAKMPNVRNTNGMAFWFWDRDANGVYSEIDVFETLPIYKYAYHASAHHGTNVNETYEYSNPSNCANINTTTDITSGWHTYGLEWAPDALTYYIDGKVVARYTQLIHKSGSGSVTPAVLKQMRVMFGMGANYGIEASAGGDVMEVDYFRYYKRKPSVYFHSYNSVTGEYTYAAKSNTPSDVITWTYSSDITDVNSFNAAGVQYIKFKRVSPTGTISITANAQQTIPSQDNNLNITNQLVIASSTFTVGNDNAYFYFDEPYFLNGNNAVKAYAASPNVNGTWMIGLKNTFTGTVDWSAPQTQTGTSATFTNLLSGQTYTIKHQEPAAGSYLVMTETTKDVEILFNSEFYVDKVQSPSPTSNTVQMLVHQVSTNPNSEWHLWLVNPDGSVNTSVDQPQWGASATFNNLIPGNTYQVTHGNYGTNQPWVSSYKIIPVDLQSNFEFYNPNLVTNCAGRTPFICYFQGSNQLMVYQKDYNPNAPSINANSSQFYLYELDAEGDYNPNNHIAFFSGLNGFFPVQLNKDYLIKHGVFSPNGYWTETKKTIHTYSKYVDCSTLPAIYEETVEHDKTETDLILSMDENEDDIPQVFPNPTSGELHIRQLNNTYQKASLLDPLGRTVMNNFTLEKETVDISQLPAGTYILRLESADKGVMQIKIIKE